MNYIIALCAASLISYLIGSLNSAIVAGYLIKHKDIRDYGSNNAGLTNIYRCFGTTCAVITFLFDICKGFLVVYGTRLALFGSGLFSREEYDVKTACMVVSLFAVLGHVFPIYYRFKGGKGILVAGMTMLAIDPLVFLFELLIFIILVAATRYVSVGSLATCVGYPVFTLIVEIFFRGFPHYTYSHVVMAGIIGLLCLLRHIPNIKRLVSHTENRFKFKK